MIIDGKKIAAEILNGVKADVARLAFVPVFCDVLVGGDPASVQYVNMKGRTAETVGIKFRRAQYPGDISTQDLVAEIKKINGEENICGLIAQLPLPAHIDRRAVLDAIEPRIDVDCTGSVNSALFYGGRTYLEFPTAAAVMAVLESLKTDFSKKRFLVLGQGQLVGRPVAHLVKTRGFTVDIADSATLNAGDLLKNADIVISAVGRPGLVDGAKIKPGSVIVDAGSSEANGSVVGDVNLESVKNIAAAVSPVPGGVGPVTVAELLANVVLAAKNRS